MSDDSDPTKLDWRDAAAASLLATLWFLLVRPGGFDLPFFWDEADVYVPGSRWVAEHGLNVTPGVFPDDYSRGHPPLLYLLAGAAFAAFGATPTVAHLLMLPFGVVALTGCAAVLVKETGIFSAGAIGAALLYDAHRCGVLRSRENLKRIALALVPLLALVVFFVWQRATAGYFIFPHHQGLFTDRPMSWANLITVIPSLFIWHGRWLVAGVALIVFFFVRRDPPSASGKWRPRTGSVFAAVLLLVAFNWIFFAKMFWLERYALPAHPGLLVLLCGLIFAIAKGNSSWALAASVLVLGSATWGLYGMFGPAERDAEEHTFAYADVIASHRDAIDSLPESQNVFVVTTWPMSVELRYPYLGYVDEEIRSMEFQYLNDHEHEHGSVTHVLVNSASSQADDLIEFARSQGLRAREEFQTGEAPRLVVYARPER